MSRVHQRKYEEIWIAQRFPGWTLDYIRSLSYADRQQIFAVLNAQDEVKAHKAQMRQQAAASRRRGRR